MDDEKLNKGRRDFMKSGFAGLAGAVIAPQ